MSRGASHIAVVGGKHFGYYTHEALLEMSKTERLQLRTQPDSTELAAIRKLSALDNAAAIISATYEGPLNGLGLLFV